MYVIRQGRRSRRITPSSISIILHKIRKPNSLIVEKIEKRFLGGGGGGAFAPLHTSIFLVVYNLRLQLTPQFQDHSSGS